MRRRDVGRRIVPAAAALATLLGFAACGPFGGAEGDAPEAVKVDIADFRFRPATVEVQRGGAVTWVNSDVAPHTATADDRSDFDTRTIRTRESGKVTFERAGTFNYFCDFHPFMRGTVEVED